MAQIKFRITKDGAICIRTPESAAFLDALQASGAIEDVKRMRLSHVEPVNWWLRVWFHFFRYWFGDEGQVSDWTRSWPCQWRVDMRLSSGPICLSAGDGIPFMSRAKAIEYELEIAPLYLLKKLKRATAGEVCAQEKGLIRRLYGVLGFNCNRRY